MKTTLKSCLPGNCDAKHNIKYVKSEKQYYQELPYVTYV